MQTFPLHAQHCSARETGYNENAAGARVCLFLRSFYFIFFCCVALAGMQLQQRPGNICALRFLPRGGDPANVRQGRFIIRGCV